MDNNTRLIRRLGALSGGLTGLALAAGIWGPYAADLWRVQVPLLFPALLFGAAVVLVLGVIAGWLAARSSRTFVGMLTWLAAAVLSILVAGHLPFEGQTVLAWLADRRFWGLPIYPLDATAQTRAVVAGFILALALAALGLVQDYRLEGIRASLNRGRLTAHAWLLLLLPLPLVFAAGLAADNLINGPLRQSVAMVAQVIRVGGSYSGNLDALSEQTGVHYSAIVAVRDRLSGPFHLTLGEVDLADDNTVVVVADFDNGAWIDCLVTLDRVSFCHDARASYNEGLQILLAGQDISQCQDCQMQVSADWQAWLRDHGRLIGEPQITRLAQQGSYVLMRAANPGSGYAVACMFSGNRTIKLVNCQEE